MYFHIRRLTYISNVNLGRFQLKYNVRYGFPLLSHIRKLIVYFS